MVVCAPCIAAAAPTLISSTGAILTTGVATLASALGIKNLSNRVKTRKKRKSVKKKKTQKGGRSRRQKGGRSRRQKGGKKNFIKQKGGRSRRQKGGKKKFIKQKGGRNNNSKVPLPRFYIEHI